MRHKIGECLIRAGLITEQQLRDALAEHEQSGERLGAVLVRMHIASEEQIARALALQLGFPFVDLADNPPDPAAVALIPKDVAIRRACIAIGLEGDLLTVAMSDPLLFSLVQDLEFQTGRRIKQVVATRGGILAAIDRSYSEAVGHREDQALPPGGLSARADTPSGDLVDSILKVAIRNAASDLHVEPMENRVAIRIRVDGALREETELPRSRHEEIVSRLKVIAGMDPAETRLPQEGRVRIAPEEGGEIDFRISTMRTLHGEKVVMRALVARSSVPALEELGMSAMALEDMRHLLRQPRGLILAVGPKGSGRTTTLSSSLGPLQSERTSIVTIEDPIEYRIAGVNQTQLDASVGLTFAAALRSVLRQDPDVILIGEIGDAETARMALEAAQRRQLVLSTLYADDTASGIARSTDVAGEPHAIAASLAGVVSQRLVRRLCVHCRAPYTPSRDVLALLHIADVDAAATAFYRSSGCDQCGHTGYRGRIGLFEVLRITDSVRRLIAERAPEDRIRQAALGGGMISLGEDGLAKLTSGVTTADELLRVFGELREARTLCPACGSPIAADFVACPQCGKRLGGACPHCGRALQPGWNFCPYCAHATGVRLAFRKPGS